MYVFFHGWGYEVVYAQSLTDALAYVGAADWEQRGGDDDSL